MRPTSPYCVAQRGPGWTEGCADALLEPEAVLARSDTRMLKRRDAGRTVGLATVDGERVVVKLFEEHGLVDALERLILGSAAARAARGIARMGAVGFAAPDLVAVLETPLVGAARRSVLVTRAVDGSPVDEAWERLRPSERLPFARQLGEYVRALHGAGVYPQDLWVTNLIAVPHGEDWRWVLVDLDRVRVYQRLSRQRRLKNLVQIERSLLRTAEPAHREAFLAGYLGSDEEDELAPLGERIAAASRRKDEQRGARR